MNRSARVMPRPAHAFAPVQRESPAGPAVAGAPRGQAAGDQQVWAAMLAHLRAHEPVICRQWFEQLEPLGVSAGVLHLRAHTLPHRDYLARCCANAFSDAARSVLGQLVSVRFLGPDEPAPPPNAHAGKGGSDHRPADHRALHAAQTLAPPQDDPARLAPGAAPGAAPLGVPLRGMLEGLSPRGTPLSPAGADTPGRTPRLDPMDAAAFEARLPPEPPLPPTPETDGAETGVEDPSGFRDGAGASAPGLPPRPLAGAATAAYAGVMIPAPRPPQPLSPAELDHLYDDGLVINPDANFESFIVGPGNRLAHAAALAVAANPGRAYNPYFVHGDVGLGKTHLLQAICLRIRQTQPGAVIYYTSCEGFMTQFMDAVAAGLMTRFRHKFRHVDVLVIDDIHFLAKRDRTQEEFFHTFNSLYQSHKQIVLSSDAAPEEIPDLEDRLVSRFKWGLVTNLAPPCYETRVEILKSKARIRGFELPDDAACFIASRIDSNIRELEGAIVKLQVLASVERTPIDLALARTALGEQADRPEPTVQIQTIINAVTDFYSVKVTDLQSKRRQRSIALPRQLCMWLARKNTRYSLEEIGGYFGGRDHTTVMHAIKTIDDRQQTDPEFASVVRSLEEKLRAPAR